jgi:pyruvate dehydrogenase E2 component (dihydrolipoamide acetyltransferase)
MDTGTIASWTIAEGDAFSPGQSLCTIETDKASMDFECQDDGFLAKILRMGANAQDIPVGTPICVVVEDSADVAAFADYTVEGGATPAASKEEEPAAVPAAATTPGSSAILFPSARHLAESNALDATGLTGTGKGGRVTKSDVMEAMQAGTLPPLTQAVAVTAAAAAPTPPVAPTAPITAAPPVAAAAPAAPVTLGDLAVPVIETTGLFEDVPNNKMRKIIAKRLTESKSTVPHFYTSMQVELDALLALRKQLAKNHDLKVSVNDFIIRCSALALRDIPEVNGTYSNGQLQLHDTVDISVAVATPTGLITPIVFGTDQLGLSEINARVKDLATRAREGKLAPHEYQGGTFSISNLGMFGIDEFSAVINPPQAAILAVGGGSRRIVPTPFDANAEIQLPPSIRTIMTAKLSADRRVVDEATAALFMSAFRQYMNQPSLLLL